MSDIYPVDISVCIVTWNNADILADCLRSVYDTMGDMSFEVIVVDNGSQDHTLESLAGEFPKVTVLSNSSNLGFTKAYNQAMRVASGRYLLVLNNDTIVHPQAVQQMLEFMETHLLVGMVGCRLVLPDGSTQGSCHTFPSPVSTLFQAFFLHRLFPGSALFGKLNMTYWDYNDTREVDWVAAAAVLVRQEAFDRIGPFDETIFAFGEDLDWCYRCRQAGWMIYFVHTAAITHLHGRSSTNHRGKEAVAVHRRSLLRSAAAYLYHFQKYGNRSSRAASLVALKGLAFSRLIIGLLRFAVSRTPYNLGYLSGYWDVFRLPRRKILANGLQNAPSRVMPVD